MAISNYRAPVAQADDKADWRSIDPATLPATLREAYEDYREAAREAAKLRDAFETAMSAAAKLPAIYRLVFGYRFGKLSVAIVAASTTTRGPASRAQSLSDFLATAHATGRRV